MAKTEIHLTGPYKRNRNAAKTRRLTVMEGTTGTDLSLTRVVAWDGEGQSYTDLMMNRKDGAALVAMIGPGLEAELAEHGMALVRLETPGLPQAVMPCYGTREFLPHGAVRAEAHGVEVKGQEVRVRVYEGPDAGNRRGHSVDLRFGNVGQIEHLRRALDEAEAALQQANAEREGAMLAWIGLA